MQYADQDAVVLSHLGEDEDRYYNALIPPICLTSLHTFDTMEEQEAFDKHTEGAYVYGRISNPTNAILERKMALLECGTKAFSFASGMAAAAAAVFAVCKNGSHIIAVRNIYGPLRRLVEEVCVQRLGMTVTFVAGDSVAEFEQAFTQSTDLVLLESPCSLSFAVQDLQAVSQLAKAHGARTYIDNSYCTPLLQKPLTLGIDLVMHTSTKYIAGHGDVLGGLLIGSDDELMERIDLTRELFGGILGPMEAWLTIRGMRTLDVRLARHAASALAVAEFLQQHHKVSIVRYTGLNTHPQWELLQRQQKGANGLLSFDLRCGTDRVGTFVNSLNLFRIGVSWGGFESLVCAPYHASTVEKAEEMGITQTTIRLHCGLENAQDLISDLSQALDKV